MRYDGRIGQRSPIFIHIQYYIRKRADKTVIVRRRESENQHRRQTPHAPHVKYLNREKRKGRP